MITYIHNRTHFINKAPRPVVLIYGSSEERSNEILKRINSHVHYIPSVCATTELPGIIKTTHPVLIIIGGRCKPETRLLIRYFAKKANNQILFSEPGIEYENSTAAVIKDVLRKIKSITNKTAYSADILNSIN